MASPRAKLAPAWTFARWSSGALLAALAAGACQLDDRTLTGSHLLDSRECPATGANDCETCLFAQCCDEVLTCGAGSDCARYLECVTNCNSAESCIDNCAVALPSGFGDALSLYVCSGAHCTACSGQPAAPTCDPGGPGQCQSTDDCDAFAAGALEDLRLVDCSTCEANLQSTECKSCLSRQTGLSEGCSSCVSDWLSCTVDNCLASCQGSADPDACERCMSSAGCTPQFESCGFSN
ncbi:MAG TPA: hypothetical protein VNN80_24515 [Polyangiaceae bacterium]|jgi:hypothetical protein|nr:hypothetical protein [Polyangiaceae bacterium]